MGFWCYGVFLARTVLHFLMPFPSVMISPVFRPCPLKILPDLNFLVRNLHYECFIHFTVRKQSLAMSTSSKHRSYPSGWGLFRKLLIYICLFANPMKVQRPPTSPRHSSLSSSRISLEPKLEIIHHSGAALERSQSTISTNRFSGIQEPDSPATCLALKITRSRLRYKYTDLTTNPGIVLAQKSSKITHCADIQIHITLPNGAELPVPLTRNIDSNIADLIKIIRAECQIVYPHLYKEMKNPAFQFYLQIDSTNEFLMPKMFLHELRVVRECLKQNLPLKEKG